MYGNASSSTFALAVTSSTFIARGNPLSSAGKDGGNEWRRSLSSLNWNGHSAPAAEISITFFGPERDFRFTPRGHRPSSFHCAQYFTHVSGLCRPPRMAGGAVGASRRLSGGIHGI